MNLNENDCWSTCPPGMTDEGQSCLSTAKAYNRGKGFFSLVSD
jgi:hypothetical protein